MENLLRVGFVGAGVHASISIYPSLRLAPLQLVAVCDLDEERAKSAAMTYGASRTYRDVEEMLRNEELDAVFVVGPFQVHYEVGKMALERGLHVWMEKPPGTSSRQTEELAELAERRSLVCHVGTMMRFATAHRLAKMVTQNEAFGRPNAIATRYMASRYPDLSRFLLGHAIHHMDLVRFFMGDVEEVFARKVEIAQGAFHIQVSYKFVSGAIGTTDMTTLQGWDSPNVRVEVTGDGHHVIVENSTQITWYRGGPFRPKVNQSEPGMLDLNHAPLDPERDAITWQPNQNWATVYSYRGYEDEIRHFAACCLTGKPGETNIRDAVSNMRLLEAVAKALETESNVKV